MHLSDSKPRGFCLPGPLDGAKGHESPKRVLAQVRIPLLVHPSMYWTRGFEIVNPLKR